MHSYNFVKNITVISLTFMSMCLMDFVNATENNEIKLIFKGKKQSEKLMKLQELLCTACKKCEFYENSLKEITNRKSDYYGKKIEKSELDPFNKELSENEERNNHFKSFLNLIKTFIDKKIKLSDFENKRLNNNLDRAYILIKSNIEFIEISIKDRKKIFLYNIIKSVNTEDLKSIKEDIKLLLNRSKKDRFKAKLNYLKHILAKKSVNYKKY